MTRLIGVVLFCAAAAAMADSGWYVGASFGHTNASGSCSTAPAHASYVCDDHDVAYGFFVGRQVARGLAIEAGYVNLGTSETSGSAEVVNGKRILPRPAFPYQVLYPASSTWRARGLEIAVVGSYPMTTNLSAIGRIGAFLWDAEYESSIPAAPASYNTSGTSLTYGAGVEYRASETFSMRATWQRYNDVDRADINVVGAAAIYRFR